MKISKHYLTAIFNADLSGLNEEDIEIVSNFIEDSGNCIFEVVPESDSFERCDLCRLYSDVVELNIIK